MTNRATQIDGHFGTDGRHQHYTDEWYIDFTSHTATHESGLQYLCTLAPVADLKQVPDRRSNRLPYLWTSEPARGNVVSVRLVKGLEKARPWLRVRAQDQLYKRVSTNLRHMAMEAAQSYRLATAHKCLDCSVDTTESGEYYMVDDEVWRQANPNHWGQLCIGCLEQRLGRKLTPKDFPFFPVNGGGLIKSARLVSRLLGQDEALVQTGWGRPYSPGPLHDVYTKLLDERSPWFSRV